MSNNERPDSKSLTIDLYDKIQQGEIQDFGALYDAVAVPGLSSRERAFVLSRCFRLIKRLYWGMFERLSAKTTPVLWKELVVPHSEVKNAGDLKRSLTISSIYIGLLDIHGYTDFTRKSKQNISRLHELDRFFETSILEAAESCGCLGLREQGDEILIIGGRASDVLMAVFQIIQIFSQENFFKQQLDIPVLREMRVSLPPFPISGGIAGGNSNTPMIITQRGEMSGFLLNTAARLQARANKLAPSSTKLIITRGTAQALNNEKQANERNRAASLDSFLHLFDCGTIAFKGMQIAHYDIIFREDDKYRLEYQQELLELFASLKNNHWQQKIFVNLMGLLDKIIKVMPDFREVVALPGFREEQVNKSSLQQKIQISKNLFLLQEDYITAIEKLNELYDILVQIPVFETLALEYCNEIVNRYNRIVHTFKFDLGQEIEANKDEIFSEQEKKLFNYFSKNSHVLQQLTEKARKSPVLTGKQRLWSTHIDKHRENLKFELYSGKK